MRNKKTIVAVLQMFDLYEKQLEKVQSNLHIRTPWSVPIRCLAQQEMEPGTLFLKSKYNPQGLERRLLNSKPVMKNANLVVEEEESLPEREVQAEETQSKTETYSTRGLNDSESDEDFSPYLKTKEKPKIAQGFGWLRSKFNGGRKRSKQKSKKKLTITYSEDDHISDIDDDEEENSMESKEKTEDIDESKENDLQTPLKENVTKKKGAGIFSGVKTGVSNVFSKIGSEKKEKHKEAVSINIEDSDEEKKPKKAKKPFVIPKKSQKKEPEKTFSCPICDQKFSEEEINEHAFTCNGTPSIPTRSNTKGSDESMDFIPLEVGSSFFTGKQNKPTKAPQSRDYSEWQKASEKVAIGKTKPVQLNDLLSEKTEAPPTNAYEEMCKESEKLCNDKITETVKDKRIVVKKKQDVDRETKAWMSSDSDSQDPNKTTDFLKQYLDPDQIVNKPKKKQIGVRKRPRVAALDEDDSMENGDNLERCFLCGKSFSTGLAYNIHVTECAARQERIAAFESRQTGQDVTNGNQHNVQQVGRQGLHQSLGNRKSWAPYSKVARTEDDVPDENCGNREETNGDSPIKTFKPVGESSMFNFDNQFKNRMPAQRASKTTATKLNRRKKR